MRLNIDFNLNNLEIRSSDQFFGKLSLSDFIGGKKFQLWNNITYFIIYINLIHYVCILWLALLLSLFSNNCYPRGKKKPMKYIGWVQPFFFFFLVIFWNIHKYPLLKLLNNLATANIRTVCKPCTWFFFLVSL